MSAIAFLMTLREMKKQVYKQIGFRIFFVSAMQFIWGFYLMKSAQSITVDCFTLSKILSITIFFMLLIFSIVWTSLWIIFLIIAYFKKHRLIWDMELIGIRMIKSRNTSVNFKASFNRSSNRSDPKKTDTDTNENSC